MRPPVDAADWTGLTADPLPLETAHSWPVLPGCGAVVVFTGTTRDHAEGRTGVTHLTYEAYEEQAVVVLDRLAADARHRWPDLGRVALLHRTGRVDLGEASVVVAVSAPHRDTAFVAARHLIDTLKESAPIWKRESWEDGDDWATGAHDVVPVETGR